MDTESFSFISAIVSVIRTETVVLYFDGITLTERFSSAILGIINGTPSQRNHFSSLMKCKQTYHYAT